MIADKDLDFDIATMAAPVRSHEWMLRELTRNLMHNAIKHSPAGGALSVRVIADAQLGGPDAGGRRAGHPRRAASPAVPAVLAGDARSGSGLGLAICHEIVRALGGTISLDNREAHGRTEGLDATVRLPLADNEA